MRLSFPRSLFLCSFLALAPATQAAEIFFDDFSSNTPGLNSTPSGWTIANSGAVDILGDCSSQVLDDRLPGNNCYIHLEGDVSIVPVENGLLTKTLWLPSGHSYTAYYDLAGNNIEDWPFGDSVDISFGTSTASVYLNPEAPFSTYSISFVPSLSGEYSLSFINSNIDGYGALLDNVRLEQVPGPLPLFGVSVALGLSRRLRLHRHHSQR
jgi:hypothetical protein